jgi:hypothetical protein
VLQRCAALPPCLCCYSQDCMHMCVRRKGQDTCVAHNARSHTQTGAMSHISRCTCMPTYEIQTRVHSLNVYTHSRSCTLYTAHRHIPLTNAHHHTLMQARRALPCTHVSVWSVELWSSAAAMCCAPSVPMLSFRRLYAHECAKGL